MKIDHSPRRDKGVARVLISESGSSIKSTEDNTEYSIEFVISFGSPSLLLVCSLLDLLFLRVGETSVPQVFYCAGELQPVMYLCLKCAPPYKVFELHDSLRDHSSDGRAIGHPVASAAR